MTSVAPAVPLASVAPWHPFRATVASVLTLSPSLRRVRLEGPELTHFADPGLDQRIKVLVGDVGEQLIDGDWYAAWLALPDEERPVMRTFTTRRVIPDELGTAVEVDMVVHDEPGPAGDWLRGAQRGDPLVLVGPDSRFEGDPGGRAFAPPADVEHVLLVGDETALPAIARILEDLTESAALFGVPVVTGVTAIVEVPSAGDVTDLVAPVGSEVLWLVRGRHGRHDGVALEAAVRAWADRWVGVSELGRHATADPGDLVEFEELVWEVPDTHAGEAAAGERDSDAYAGVYAWVAAETGVVKGLRRLLRTELGLDRSQVALMGYWRRGAAQG